MANAGLALMADPASPNTEVGVRKSGYDILGPGYSASKTALNVMTLAHGN
jgi:hypothetical protein